jgi:hypothetical protein
MVEFFELSIESVDTSFDEFFTWGYRRAINGGSKFFLTFEFCGSHPPKMKQSQTAKNLYLRAILFNGGALAWLRLRF